MNKVGWLQNETTDQTASESCQSSDDDSDTGTLNNTGLSTVNQTVGALSLPPPPLPPPPLPLPLLPVGSVFENMVHIHISVVRTNTRNVFSFTFSSYKYSRRLCFSFFS